MALSAPILCTVFPQVGYQHIYFGGTHKLSDRVTGVGVLASHLASLSQDHQGRKVVMVATVD